MLEVVTGGSGSGKSAYAEHLIEKSGEGARFYVATMRPFDDQCVEKIEKHRDMRAEKRFVTIECYQDLHLIEVPVGAVVLLECMSNLTANECYRDDVEKENVENRIMDGILSLQKQTKTLIIVTNEVFSDGRDYDAETDSYRRILGTINKRLAGLADRVTEVVYGIPLVIKV